jgi:hypothetical protein
MRPLKAPRYAEGASPTLVEFIISKLHYLTFEEAMEFYEITVPHLKPIEFALLGANDRFFLLTGLLNRVDLIHPWLYDRCREVENDPDGYLDLWARGHGKSSIITFGGAIQEIIVDPEITIGIFSVTADISRKFLAQIKQEIEGNGELIATYPDVFWTKPRVEAPSWSLNDGLIVKRKGNPKEGTLEAHGLIDAMPTGRHYRLLCFDDIVTERHVSNPEQIRKVTERVELSDNLGIGDGTRKWFIGTRYSFADSYGHLLEHGIVRPRLYPATDDGTLDGNPVLLSPASWEERKKAQRTTISAQMLQNPIAGKEQLFRTEWLNGYWVRPLTMNVYIMGDPSLGRSKSSDRTAIAVIGVDTLGNKYFLDGYAHRMKLSERWKNLRDLHVKWSRMPGVQLISVGWERYGVQADIEYFEEQMRLEGHRFEVKELNWTGQVGAQSKASRVGRLEPDIRLGKFFFPWRVYHPHVTVPGSNQRSDSVIWFITPGDDAIHYRHYAGRHAQERQAQAAGERWRIQDPIRRVDEDGDIYDVIRIGFEEVKFFPFSPRDDLVDVMSRIYDMEPRAAVRYESVPVIDYPDA